MTVYLLRPKAIGEKVIDCLQLMKWKLSSLVIFTAGLGYLLATGTGVKWSHFALTIGGLFLIVGAANTFNQILERRVDRLMERTANRPLPAERMTAMEATLFGVMATLSGMAVLATVTNGLTVCLALFAFFAYVFLYTPLKSKTNFCLFIGALSGALPPVLGWTAVRSSLGWEALVLFATQFFWQFPHFWAIAWLYRDDYQRVGFRVLPVIKGKSMVGVASFSFALTVVALSFVPFFLGWVHPVYWVGVSLLGGLFLVAAGRFWRDLTLFRARRLLVTADLYLPTLLLLWWVTAN